MNGWEERALDTIGRRTAGRPVDAAGVVTLLGETPVVWAAVATASLACARAGRWGPASRALVTLAVASAARRGLAGLVGRTRPPERLWRGEWTGPSFPSRHTTLAGLGAGLIVEALTGDHHAGLVSAGAVGALVGASRLVLGVHWPTDVIGGWVFTATALRLAHLFPASGPHVAGAGLR